MNPQSYRSYEKSRQQETLQGSLSMSIIPSTAVPVHAVRSHCVTVAHDVALYRELTRQMPGGLPPTCFLLPYMGEEARSLFKRRAIDAPTWCAFRAVVAHRYPDVPAWTAKQAADGTKLESVPERIAYEAITPRLPQTITLVLHARLPIAGRWFRSDFDLIDQSGYTLRIEVAGGLGRDQKPEREREYKSARLLAEKLAAYALAALPTPKIIYADDTCDMQRLDQAVDGILRLVQDARPRPSRHPRRSPRPPVT